ncbi:MAG: NAD(+)/NADH kinase [Clostridium sp.]|jgi:NAD+ kinase|nr:NAD(+)/NADH kinase [Clostridium sp.]
MTRNFIVYTNHKKDLDGQLSIYVQQYFEQLGHTCTIIQDDYRLGDPAVAAAKAPAADVEAMIVLGGDGTLLRASKASVAWNVPIIGVNLGSLGYMAQVDRDELDEALLRIHNKQYQISQRMLLSVAQTSASQTLQTDGIQTSILSDRILNDVAITRGGSLKLLVFEVYVNGHFFYEYHADGILLSTPVGSTGYSLSAGGPICSPDTQLILLTPICAHSIAKGSVVLSADDEVEIRIPCARDSGEQCVELAIDGRAEQPLCTGQRLCVHKSKEIVKLLTLEEKSFLDVFSQKMAASVLRA